MLPKITIITPSYNQAKYIENTIQSVLNQNYRNLEYIIIDGGSTDGTIDILKKYEHYLAYWVSEKDKGQSHAINKGLKKATGDIINWLNSDDMLVTDALNIIADTFLKNPQYDFYLGDFIAIDGNGETLFHRKCSKYHFKSLFYGRQLSSQPAVFFKRSVLDKTGCLNESLTFCMDIDFWIKAALLGMKFKQIKDFIAKPRFHKHTKSAMLNHIRNKEHKMIIRESNKLVFKEDSNLEQLYYLALNRIWRYISAINRMIYRRDFTFGKVGKAFKKLVMVFF